MNRSVERDAEHVHTGLVPRHWSLSGVPITHSEVDSLYGGCVVVGGSAAIVECDSPIFHIL